MTVVALDAALIPGKSTDTIPINFGDHEEQYSLPACRMIKGDHTDASAATETNTEVFKEYRSLTNISDCGIGQHDADYVDPASRKAPHQRKIGTTRLYFNEDADEFGRGFYKGTTQYASPVHLDGNKWCEIGVSTRGEQPYFAVICFLLNKGTKGSGIVRILWGDELKLRLSAMQSDGECSLVRVLLRTQVIGTSFYAEVKNSKTSKSGHVQICYVEINQSYFEQDSFDFVLPHIPLPRKSINIWHHDSDSYGTRQRTPALIMFCGVSASGSHIATLSSTGSKMHLDLWKPDLSKVTQTAAYPPLPSTPLAHSVIDCSLSEQVSMELSLSWDGSQTAVYRGRYATSSPIQLFIMDNLEESHPDNNQHQQILSSFRCSTRHLNCTDLRSFKGSAKFTNLSTVPATPKLAMNNESERFIAYDGMNIHVYSTSVSPTSFFMWKQLYMIQVLPSPDFTKVNLLMTAVTGGVIILEMSPYRLKILSLLSGKSIYQIETNDEIQDYFVSSDGQTIAVLTNSTLLLYAAASGDLIQTSRFTLYESSQFLNGNSKIVTPSKFGRWNRLSVLDSGTLIREQDILVASGARPLIQDLQNGVGLQSLMLDSAIVTHFHGSILDLSFLGDISVDEDIFYSAECTHQCAENLYNVPVLQQKRTIYFPGGTYTMMSDGRIGRRGGILSVSVEYDDGQKRHLRLMAGSFYFLEKRGLVVAVFFENGMHCSVWSMPKSSGGECELLLHWRMEPSRAAYTLQACSHEKILRFSQGGLSIYITPERVCSSENAKFFFDAIHWLIEDLENCQTDVASAIIRYFQSHINRYPCHGNHTLSVISKLCSVWSPWNHDIYRLGLKKLLKNDAANNWIPRNSYSPGSNPVEIMLNHAKIRPKALEISRVLIEYCIGMATKEQDLGFIQYLCECMDEFVAQHPDIALQVTGAFAYVQCNNRQYIINHHSIAHPPTLRQLWAPNGCKLSDCLNPIFQEQQCSTAGEGINTDFTEDIYVAPIQLLWTLEPNGIGFKTRTAGDKQCLIFSWPQALYRLLCWQINPASRIYIRPRYYELGILDNPAIMALVHYKWNTFAFALWGARFLVQCIYYLLILLVAFIQVYSDQPESLLGIFITISGFSCLFLWLEFVQWRASRHYVMSIEENSDIGVENQATTGTKDCQLSEREPKFDSDQNAERTPRGADRNTGDFLIAFLKGKASDHKRHAGTRKVGRSPYFRSPYNLLDLAMYALPLGSSIHHILNIVHSDGHGVTWDYSFCVVLVFLHLLAEMRVSETVCKYITIVFGILVEIRVFFMVFAGGVLFFSLAFLHVLYGVGSSAWDRPQVSLPSNFFGAITTVYLIMGGRYDPLQDELFAKSEGTETEFSYKNWPLHVMVMIYFFFSSILMLNVLIALINVAFSKGDDSWHQVWLENRLRYVESAENMSYHIPGFRQAFDWFPEKIYYTATPFQVNNYKQLIKERRDSGVDLNQASTDATTSPEEGVPRLREQLEQQDRSIKNQGDQVLELRKAIEKTQDDISELKQDIRAVLEALCVPQRRKET